MTATLNKPAGLLAGMARAAAVVAAVEAKSTRHETPCGKGSMVWRRWSSERTGRAGSPVLLVHGGGGSWTHWIRNIEALAARHTVWALDLPGLGDSAVPDAFTIDEMGVTVERGLRALIPDGPVDVVGFSFGGAISTYVAMKLEGRLRNLVLTGSRFNIDLSREFPQLVSWKEIEDPEARLAGHRRNLEIMMIADQAHIDDLAIYVQSTNTPRARFFGPKLDPNGKLHEFLPHVRPQKRVTGISGLEDQIAKPIMHKQDSGLKAIHSNGIFHGIADAGHWVQYEGAERYNAILLDTLAGD